MYRIYFGAVWTDAQSLAEAQDIALTEARVLTRACGFAVEAKVFRHRRHGRRIRQDRKNTILILRRVPRTRLD